MGHLPFLERTRILLEHLEIGARLHKLLEHRDQRAHDDGLFVFRDVKRVEGVDSVKDLVGLRRPALPYSHAQGVEHGDPEGAAQDIAAENIGQAFPGGAAPESSGQRHRLRGAWTAHRLRHLLDRSKAQAAVSGGELRSGKEQPEHRPFQGDRIQLVSQQLFYFCDALSEHRKFVRHFFSLSLTVSRMVSFSTDRPSCPSSV